MTDQELTEIEGQLLEIPPAPLSDQLMGRLETQSVITDLLALRPTSLGTTALQRMEDAIFEAELSAATPAVLSDELIARLELTPTNAALATHPLPSMDEGLLNRLCGAVQLAETGEEVSTPNIIAFPHKTSQERHPAPRKVLAWMSSAAAVALFGVFCGIAATSGSNKTQEPAVALQSSPALSAANLVPASAAVTVRTNRTLLNAQDRGILRTNNDNSGYRAYHIEAMETYFMEDSAGKKIEIRQPKKELILVPAVTD